jgi:transposase InsO family protein
VAVNGTSWRKTKEADWPYLRAIDVDFIRPGKPVDNAHIESFNGKSSPILAESTALGQSPDSSKASGDLKSRTRVTIPGFRTARRVASRR